MAKILLAEDEVNIASFIERGLKEFGHSVTVCHDGNTGWRILQEEPFDLVILDIIMPKINGLELCHLAGTIHHASVTQPHFQRRVKSQNVRSEERR